MSASITVKVQNVVSGDLFEIPFSRITYTEELNGGKNIQITIDYLAVKAIADAYSTTPYFIFTSSYREMWVEMNGKKIWYGVISDFHLTRDANGQYKLDIYGIDFFSLFQKRFTGNSRSFSAVDAGDIAWTLINESQTADSPYSDFGITRGTHPATVPRTVTYNFAEIRQSIIDLSNVKVANGFDFDIDTLKVFNIFYPYKGSARNNIILDQKNISGFAGVIGLMNNLTNKVYVVGKGVNTDVAYVYVAAPVAYRSAFKVLEEVVSDKGQSDLTALNDQANQFLAFNQAPVTTLTITHDGNDPDITTYSLGDSLAITLPELNLSNTLYRVKKRQVDIDENATVVVNIDLQVI